VITEFNCNNHTRSFDDAAIKPILLNRKAQVGALKAMSDPSKPVLVDYLVGSAIGSNFLAVLFKDATRPFTPDYNIAFGARGLFMDAFDLPPLHQMRINRLSGRFGECS
jgi:hypothetical protein